MFNDANAYANPPFNTVVPSAPQASDDVAKPEGFPDIAQAAEKLEAIDAAAIAPLPEGSAAPGVNAPPETVAEANAEAEINIPAPAAYPLTAEEIASLKDCTCTGSAEAHQKVKTGTTTQKVDTFTFICPTSSI